MDHHRVGSQNDFLVVNEMFGSLRFPGGQPGRHIHYRHVGRKTFVDIYGLYSEFKTCFAQQLTSAGAL